MLNDCKLLFASCFCLFALLFSPHLADAQQIQALSFEEALTKMVQNNQGLKAVEYERFQRELDQKSARGLYMPQIAVGASYMMMSDNIHLDLDPVRDAIVGVKFAGVPDNAAVQAQKSAITKSLGNWDKLIQDKNFGVVDASFKMPLFTGGKIYAANKAAAFKVQESKAKWDQKKSELITELAQRYFGVNLAKQVVEVRKQVVDGMQKHLSDAKSLEKNGIITQAERLHAEVYAAQADRELKKANRMAEIAMAGLSNTLNDSSTFLLSSPLFVAKNIGSKSFFVEKSVSDNAILKQVQSKKEMAKQNHIAERAAYFPTVFAFGQKELVNKNYSEYLPTWAVGVGLQLTLFDGLAREQKVKASKMLIQQVDAVQQKATSDIATLIDKTYNEVMMQEEQLESLDASMKFSEEYVRIREKAFKEGMATSTDVVDSQLALAKIRTERLQAAYEFDIALAKLMEISGQVDLLQNLKNSNSVQEISYEKK